MSQNTSIILLNGFPGTGKLTIATELAKRENVRLIDNHATANLIFAMVRKDGTTPIPKPAWDAIREIRRVVAENLPTLALPELSFVFTHALAKNDADDIATEKLIRDMAEKRGSRYLFVNLICDLEENQRRIVSANRGVRMKMTDADGLKTMYNQYALLEPNDVESMTLDVTNLSPEQAAQVIWEKNQLLHQPIFN